MTNYDSRDIVIAILNWNGRNLLQQFLPGVIQNSNGSRIVVIDNASSDDSVSFVKNNFPEVQLIVHPQNLGYAGGYNEGIKQIKAGIICCLNSDVEVTPNWLEPIKYSFNSNTNIAVLQPKILDYNKRDFFEYAGAAGGFIDKFGYPYCRGRVFEHIEKDEGQYNDERPVFWASGACLFIKTETFNQLGGFDSDFFAHMEEIDLCWRARNAGRLVVYNGVSKVYHVGGSTLNSSSPQKTFLNFRNSLFALVKNSPSPFGLVLFRMLLDGVAGIRFLFQLKLDHFVAIIKAHLSFYAHLRSMMAKRKKQPEKRANYYDINSVVWEYYIKRRRIL